MQDIWGVGGGPALPWELKDSHPRLTVPLIKLHDLRQVSAHLGWSSFIFQMSVQGVKSKVPSSLKTLQYCVLPSTQQHCLLHPLPCHHTVWVRGRWVFHLIPSVLISELLERKDLALFLCLSTTLPNRDYVCNQWWLKRQSIKLCTSIRCYFYPFCPK